MAVYFQPQYKPWWADLASATLSGLVKGMLDRDAAARAQRVNSNRWGEFEKLYDEASGQYAAPRESPLTIQGAPETKKLSQLFAPESVFCERSINPAGINICPADAMFPVAARARDAAMLGAVEPRALMLDVQRL